MLEHCYSLDNMTWSGKVPSDSSGGMRLIKIISEMNEEKILGQKRFEKR